MYVLLGHLGRSVIGGRVDDSADCGDRFLREVSAAEVTVFASARMMLALVFLKKKLLISSGRHSLWRAAELRSAKRRNCIAIERKEIVGRAVFLLLSSSYNERALLEMGKCQTICLCAPLFRTARLQSLLFRQLRTLT